MDLTLIVDYSKYHDVHVGNQFATDALGPDVVQFQTLQDFDRWKQQGRLLHYKARRILQGLRRVQGSAGRVGGDPGDRLQLHVRHGDGRHHGVRRQHSPVTFAIGAGHPFMAWGRRTDVTPPAGLKPIREYPNAHEDGFPRFMADRAAVERWKQTFALYFGEVEGDPTPGRLGLRLGA